MSAPHTARDLCAEADKGAKSGHPHGRFGPHFVWPTQGLQGHQPQARDTGPHQPKPQTLKQAHQHNQRLQARETQGHQPNHRRSNRLMSHLLHQVQGASPSHTWGWPFKAAHGCSETIKKFPEVLSEHASELLSETLKRIS